ncbi:hypothetical protein HPB50_005019 [Hyalomma asiaticum]|uniref:Uncharacterized protein n=1 Tax=Hyalomma asiaticum TaxID=266040 RepID=A0ACB7SNC9_HYAAI|nr:hypothetical protein HPB50_005019 [Hyalomma asiaticum]
MECGTACCIDMLGAIHLLTYSWQQVESTTLLNCFARAKFVVRVNTGESKECADECDSLLTEVLEHQASAEALHFESFHDLDSDMATSPDLTDSKIVAAVVPREVEDDEYDDDDIEADPSPPLMAVADAMAVMTAFVEKKGLMARLEMIIDKDNGRDVPRYLIYDIIRFQGEEVWRSDFCKRLMCISNELYEPRKAAMQEGRIKRESESFGVRQKQFWDAAFTYKLLSDKFAQSMPHELDGLIFQPKKDRLLCLTVFGRANRVLKWKPPHLNTIDFRLKITKETGQGLVPKLIGQLFVGGYDHPYGIIKVNKQLRNMDNKIIECKVDKGGWTLLRERTDKSFPNSFSTAEGVMESIRNPVDKEHLLSVIAGH